MERSSEITSPALILIVSLKVVDAISKSIFVGVPTVFVGYGLEIAPIALDPDNNNRGVTPSPLEMFLGVYESWDEETSVALEEAVEGVTDLRSAGLPFRGVPYRAGPLST